MRSRIAAHSTVMFGLQSLHFVSKTRDRNSTKFLVAYRVCIKSCPLTTILVLTRSLLNDVFSNADSITCRKWLVVNKELDRNRKEVLVAQFEGSFQNFPGGTEKDS
jgi:hypothetical protein